MYIHGETPFDRAIDAWGRTGSDAHERIIIHLTKANPVAAVENDKVLLAAASQGSKALVVLLLEAGADPHKIDVHGWTPLMAARENNHDEIAEIIFARGAALGSIPTKWNTNDKGSNVKISPSDPLRVEWVPGMSDLFYHFCSRTYNSFLGFQGCGSVRSDHPFPAARKEFYYEIEVIKDSTENPAT
jgi:hypothetical protein